jgi:hypothetical protein
MTSNIVILGGGRWAKVLISIFSKVARNNANIYHYSGLHSNSALKITLESSCNGKVVSLLKLNQILKLSNPIVIVATKARDHYHYLKWTISNGLTSFSEKPLTLNFKQTQELITLSKSAKTHLGSLNTFLHSSYFNKFIDEVRGIDKLKMIIVHWEDPRLEYRYGDKKFYDKSLPIFTDILPHIVPLLAKICDLSMCSIEINTFDKGGSELSIKLNAGQVECNIHLKRNGTKRTRKFSVCNVFGATLEINFQNHDAEIYKDSNLITFNQAKKTTLEIMAMRILDGSITNNYHEDFSSSYALLSNKIIDTIYPIYLMKQNEWIQNFHLSDNDYKNNSIGDYIYAKDEISFIRE